MLSDDHRNGSVATKKRDSTRVGVGKDEMAEPV